MLSSRHFTLNPGRKVAALKVVRMQIEALCCLLLALLLCVPNHVMAQGEHARRAAVEVQVLLGDLRRLEVDAPGDLQVQGLKQRILGSFALLEVLLRLADAELKKPPADHRSRVNALTDHWNQQNYIELRQQLQALATSYPLHFAIPDMPLTHSQKANSSHLHNQLCSACHDNAVLSSERPAYDLFAEATSLTQVEFIARLLNGVRGDASTGLDNPLSDMQIRQLYLFYLHGESKND